MEWSTDTKGQNLAHDGTVVQPPPAERQAIASADLKVADRLDIAHILQELPVSLFPEWIARFSNDLPEKQRGLYQTTTTKTIPDRQCKSYLF